MTPLTMRQGDTWTLRVVWWPAIEGTDRPDLTAAPINLTGYTARLQVRRRAGDLNTPVLALTSSPAAGLTIDAVAGAIAARAAPSQTQTIPAGRWWWEIEVTNVVDTYTLGDGPMVVLPQLINP